MLIDRRFVVLTVELDDTGQYRAERLLSTSCRERAWVSWDRARKASKTLLPHFAVLLYGWTLTAGLVLMEASTIGLPRREAYEPGALGASSPLRALLHESIVEHVVNYYANTTRYTLPEDSVTCPNP